MRYFGLALYAVVTLALSHMHAFCPCHWRCDPKYTALHDPTDTDSTAVTVQAGSQPDGQRNFPILNNRLQHYHSQSQ